MPPRSPCKEGSVGPAARTTVGTQPLHVGPSGWLSCRQQPCPRSTPPQPTPPRLPHGQLGPATPAPGAPSALASAFLGVVLQLGVPLCQPLRPVPPPQVWPPQERYLSGRHPAHDSASELAPGRAHQPTSEPTVPQSWKKAKLPSLSPFVPTHPLQFLGSVNQSPS